MTACDGVSDHLHIHTYRFKAVCIVAGCGIGLDHRQTVFIPQHG